MKYQAIVHKEAGSDYGVSFPDFPGCVTAGRTLAEALMMARHALRLHINGMLDDGEKLPKPSEPLGPDGATQYFAISVSEKPNAKTRRAMDELERGEAKNASSVDDLLIDLNSRR